MLDINIEIDDETTISYKNKKVYEINKLLELETKEAEVEVEKENNNLFYLTRKINKLLPELEKWSKICFVYSPVEFNLFNGKKAYFEDMFLGIREKGEMGEDWDRTRRTRRKIIGKKGKEKEEKKGKNIEINTDLISSASFLYDANEGSYGYLYSMYTKKGHFVVLYEKESLLFDFPYRTVLCIIY